MEARHGDNREIGLEAGQRGGGRLYEHMPGEQAVPGQLGINPHVQAVLRVGAGVAVPLVNFPVGQVALHLAVKLVEGSLVYGHVLVAPPDIPFAGRLFNYKFILRRARGMLAGMRAQSAAGGYLRFLTGNGVLVKRGCRKVLEYVFGGFYFIHGGFLFGFYHGGPLAVLV